MLVTQNTMGNLPHHIKKVSVEKLFGRYNYKIPSDGQMLTDLNIIYGPNGAGKTTLLNLVFHILSPSDNAGHRNKISEIPFSYLEVELHDGTIIYAKKDNQLLIGPVEFSILNSDKEDVIWKFVPGVQSHTFRAEDIPSQVNIDTLPTDIKVEVARALEQRRFFQEIRKLQVNSYLLTSDRILLSDAIKDTARIDTRSEFSRSRAKISDVVTEHRMAAVNEALNNASSWLKTKFLERSYGGNETATNFYQEVVKKIAKTTYKTKAGLNKQQEEKAIASIENSIVEISHRSKEFSKFGLNVASISQDILATIKTTRGNRLQLIHTILEPHLASITARFDSLQPLFDLVNNFVLNFNKFLKDKELVYSVRGGFKIIIDASKNPPEEISSFQLSSGEQQLILLFCHTLIARDTPSIFIIDEPEISLNIIWQRMLVSALLSVGQDSKTQLIFASHSMEILSKHRNRVISMKESQA